MLLSNSRFLLDYELKTKKGQHIDHHLHLQGLFAPLQVDEEAIAFPSKSSQVKLGKTLLFSRSARDFAKLNC
jgi:hypothetical protein